MFVFLRNFHVVLLLCADVGLLVAAEPDFEKDLKPILKANCVRCHGPAKQEARIRLDNLSTDLSKSRTVGETWRRVLDVLNAGEMPPEDETQLSADQRTTLTSWIEAAIEKAIAAQQQAQATTVLRRLNRAEYQNTMTDLLGLEMNYARDLPPDPISSDGFKNDGRSLQMSALELEYFLETARRALDRVVVSVPAPKVYNYEFSEPNVKKWLRNPQISSRLGRQQQFLAKMVDDYPEAGDFLVRVKLTAELKPNVGYPLLEVSVGYRPDTKILFREFDLIEITSPEEQTFEFRGRIEQFPLPVRGQGKFPGLVVRVRNVYDDGSPLPKPKKQKGKPTEHPEEPNLPTIVVRSVEFHGPVFDSWPPARHRQILFDSPQREEDLPGYVTEVLTRFMTRAYRRPVGEEEVDKMLDFFLSIQSDFPTFEEAIRETLAMVLIQPDFLYVVEPARKADRIGDWELASRLSYFLWSTMPDQRLMDLAANKSLHQPSTLSEEVERMLRDPRSSRFIEQFTEQWLHLEVLDRVAIDQDYYPSFDDRLKEDMRGETQQFFAELVRHNLSALNLLSSDFTVLNEPLAKHYGVKDVYGRAFRRVELKPEQHRGGLLGQASVLLSNSTGRDSHAVRRAVWIRDRLLNDPPAPPPPDVPSLEEADPQFHKLSIREQLEIHRNREACASCHRNIDPWGIALENFDAVGLWRDHVRRKVGKKFERLPVGASDSLPNGHQLDGVDILRAYLVNERKDDFARSLVARLLTFALGRRLELSDQKAVDDITTKFAAYDYQLRGLIQTIVASAPFQTR